MRLPRADLFKLSVALRAHHSQDPSLLRSIREAMSKDPWQCGHCRKTAKASANNCSHCGASWHDANPGFIPPDRAKSQKKKQNQWDESWGYSDSYGKSPRSSQRDANWHQRPKSPRQGRFKTGRGKGNNKGNAHNGPHGKGKQDQGAAGQEGYYPIQGVAKGLPPEPPWRPTLPSMPSLPPLPPPSTPHPESKVVQTLNKLTAAIKKKPDQYDPEVHAILQSATLAEGLNAKDQMLQAAEVMGEAREALDAARLGRYQNHIRWRDFLASAVSRWQEYTSDFQKQEKEFHDAIEHSKAVMAEAKERFEVNKAALSEDDQLTYGGNVATDDPMAEKVQDNTSGKALQANLDQMAANLATLRTSAEASVLAEEQVTKRPRLSEGDGLGAPTAMPSSTAASHGSNAMQPFPVRTETQSFAEPGKM